MPIIKMSVHRNALRDAILAKFTGKFQWTRKLTVAISEPEAKRRELQKRKHFELEAKENKDGLGTSGLLRELASDLFSKK